MFDPTDWYWKAADGRIFSSAARSTASATDPAFTAWLEDGNTPATWPMDANDNQTSAALADTLDRYGQHFSDADRMLSDVNDRRNAKIAGGYQHNFGGTAGTRMLDQRGESDAINWLGLKGIADSMVADGQGAVLLGLRDASNSTFEASATTVAAAILGMGMWRSSIIAHSWTLKDAIADSPDAAALDLIDIDAGWPS